MTSPWLRCPVLFVHGSNHNESTPFTTGKLPTKSEIRDASNKNLAIAIISTSLTKEKELHPFLASLLRQSGIELPASNNSSSTIDLTNTEIAAISHDDSCIDDDNTNASRQKSVAGIHQQTLSVLPHPNTTQEELSIDSRCQRARHKFSRGINTVTTNPEPEKKSTSGTIDYSPSLNSNFFAQHFPSSPSNNSRTGTICNGHLG